MKKIYICIVVICTFFSLTSCSISSPNNSTDNSSNQADEMKITVLNVKDADCIVITTENSNIVIDTGESDDKDVILNYLKQNKISNIDYLILTHFDKDHIGGAPKIIKNITTKNVIEPNYIKDSSEYKKLKTCLEEKQITPNILTPNFSFSVDNINFIIYPALKDNYGENASNEFSLVISATHHSNKFLFAGDADNERLQELSTQLDLQHTFLKLPHHGVYDKNSPDFLKAVNAKYAVITCSEENPPSSKILDILKSTNTKVYLSSNGNISCTSNGSSIKISQ